MKLAHKHCFEAIGTQWAIETKKPLSKTEQRLIDDEIESFDKVYSRFRDDSLVTRAAKEAPGTFAFPGSIEVIYDIYLKLEKVTGGRVNPLVGKSLEKLGYDAQYSLQAADGPAEVPPSFAETVVCAGNKLTFSRSELLDIGAVGKGYLVDRLASVLSGSHDEYVVDGSGDIAVCRQKAEVIGLEHPADPSRIIGTVTLQDKSLCASGINRRTWADGLHHVLDATTGQPLENGIIATWAIADNTFIADALATGLFFTPASRLQQTFGEFVYVTININGQVDHNIGAVGEIYS